MDLAASRWWQGPLDVERLARGAVASAADAASELAAARGLRIEVGSEPALIAASFAAPDHLRVDGREPQGWAPFSGFVPAADGWVRLHANYPHHQAALCRALGVTTREQLHAAVRAAPAQEVEDVVTAHGGIAVAVRTEQEWRAHPHGRALRPAPWIEVETRAARASLPAGDEPLAGLRVLDLTRVIAGPSCTQLLACLGADVLRIDPPGRPELLDQYLSNAMGKRSAQLDLGADLDVVRSELLPHADVVVVGYRPGSLARFGLDPASLSAQRPDLVVGSLSAWGEHGPWGERAGFDSIVQAATGIADICADDAGRPGALPVQALDHATGYRLAAAIMDLLRREHGGVVRASLLGAAHTLLGLPRTPHAETLDLEVPTSTVDSPYGPLTVTPLPFTVDGRHVTAPVTGYAAATPAFLGPAPARA